MRWYGTPASFLYHIISTSVLTLSKYLDTLITWIPRAVFLPSAGYAPIRLQLLVSWFFAEPKIPINEVIRAQLIDQWLADSLQSLLIKHYP